MHQGSSSNTPKRADEVPESPQEDNLHEYRECFHHGATCVFQPVQGWLVLLFPSATVFPYSLLSVFCGQAFFFAATSSKSFFLGGLVSGGF